MHHELQIWPKFFEAVVSGDKTFEIREKRDRNFQVDDILHLSCYDPTTGYDGRQVSKRVSYTIDDPTFCPDGYIIMGLRDLEKPKRYSESGFEAGYTGLYFDC